MTSVNVACVLRSGGIYDVRWVEILRAAVARNLSFDHRFVCLTDMVEEVEAAGIEAVELEEGWPGWWSKIELFRYGLFDGPVLYLDLDSVIVRPLDGLFVWTGLCSMQEPGTAGGMCSTAMAWNGDHSAIFRTFWRDPEAHMHRHDVERPERRVGDQSFIFETMCQRRMQLDFWGPMVVSSYKRHCQKVLPNRALVVAFHGSPKPPAVVDQVPWVAKHWSLKG